MLVAPLSCTSLNKWGNGISDTLALGLPSEGVHMGVPVAAMPYFNRAQGAQPAVARSIADLRAQGVTVATAATAAQQAIADHAQTTGQDRYKADAALKKAVRHSVPPEDV